LLLLLVLPPKSVPTPLLVLATITPIETPTATIAAAVIVFDNPLP
jgi:hypothetical protein